MNKLLKYHLKCIYTPVNFFILGVVFVINYFISYLNYGTFSSHVLKQTAFVFYMPLDSKMDILRCLLVITPLIIMIGYFLEQELKNRTIYVLIRIKSDVYYFISLLGTSWIFIFSGLLFGYGITTVLSALFKHDSYNDWGEELLLFKELPIGTLIYHQFFLLLLLLLVLVTAYMLLIFVAQNNGVSFLIILIGLLVSLWASFSNPLVIQWCPLVHGLIIFKELSSYSFTFFYQRLLCYLIILNVINYFIYTSKREKIFYNEIN